MSSGTFEEFEVTYEPICYLGYTMFIKRSGRWGVDVYEGKRYLDRFSSICAAMACIRIWAGVEKITKEKCEV